MTIGVGVLSNFHDSLQDAMYVFDENDVLVDANDRVGEISGRDVEDVLGVTHADLLDAFGANDSIEAGHEAYETVAKGEVDASRAEFELRNVDGRVVPVDVRYTRHEAYVVAILRNLTEARERERRLETLSEQLDVLNRVLRHDIRNDMNVVQGWLGELREHVDDDGKDAFGNVEEAVKHTIDLTTEAGDLAAVLGSGDELPVEGVALDRVLHQQIVKSRSEYPDATVRVDGSVPAVDVVANEMLSSVFDNLLGNAIVHNDRDDPTVTLSVDGQSSDVDGQSSDVDSPAGELGPGEDAVVVRVADDGHGVPESLHDTLFGRGEKGVDSPGTGMGLYLVDQLVAGYGGDVHVEPNEPRGSVFVVRLRAVES